MPDTVLIVDDSQSVRKELRQHLTSLGYTVIAEASNGIEAIDAYVRFKPVLMTLDLVMPQLDGLSALREIRSYDPNAKVILITSSFSQKIRSKAEELGVEIWVEKPVNRAKLEEALLKLKAPQKQDIQYG